jgi:hypothetical protein
MKILANAHWPLSIHTSIAVANAAGMQILTRRRLPENRARNKIRPRNAPRPSTGRLRRVRNALAHGGPVDDESAETVQAFVEQLARLSLAVALQGLLEAKTVAAANQERKQWIDRWKTALPAAANVPDALFGPTP